MKNSNIIAFLVIFISTINTSWSQSSEKHYKKTILGTWNMVSLESYNKNEKDGTITNIEKENRNNTLTFTKEGKTISNDYDTANYSIQKDLFLEWKQDETDTAKLKILKLNSHNLIFGFEDGDSRIGNEKVRKYWKITFKR
ncbi:MAG TPA: hypothetical protein VLZ83_05380 [Edaphocola sp.]|nr:hypothetical protein [Edaphocola sp.]